MHPAQSAAAVLFSFLALAPPALADNNSNASGAESNAELVWCGCYGDAKGGGTPSYYSKPFQTSDEACGSRAVRKAFSDSMARASGKTRTWSAACYTYASEDAVLDKFETAMDYLTEKGLASEWVTVTPPQD